MTQYVNSIDGTVDYINDNAGQLTEADYSNANLEDEYYDYDDNGNRVSIAGGDAYVTDDNNRLVSFTDSDTGIIYGYTYDDEGNRILKFVDKGTEFVIWKSELRSGAESPRGWQNSNLQGRFNHFLQSSGIPQITKPFQSMRSSRENEMVEEYPMKVVVDWVGHDIKVAAKHYLDSSNEEHHKKAISGCEKVAQNAAHTTTAGGRQGVTNQETQEIEKAASPLLADYCGLWQDNTDFALPPEWATRGSNL